MMACQLTQELRRTVSSQELKGALAEGGCWCTASFTRPSIPIR